MMHALFEDLSPQVVTVLQRISRPQRFEAGAILCQEGEVASEAWLIVTGQVTLSVRMPGGGCASLCTVGAGAVLGELALLDDLARRSATVVALTAVQTLQMAAGLALCAACHVGRGAAGCAFSASSAGVHGSSRSIVADASAFSRASSRRIAASKPGANDASSASAAAAARSAATLAASAAVSTDHT